MERSVKTQPKYQPDPRWRNARYPQIQARPWLTINMPSCTLFDVFLGTCWCLWLIGGCCRQRQLVQQVLFAVLDGPNWELANKSLELGPAETNCKISTWTPEKVLRNVEVWPRWEDIWRWDNSDKANILSQSTCFAIVINCLININNSWSWQCSHSNHMRSEQKWVDPHQTINQKESAVVSHSLLTLVHSSLNAQKS